MPKHGQLEERGQTPRGVRCRAKWAVGGDWRVLSDDRKVLQKVNVTLVAGGHLIQLSVREKLPAAKCHLVLVQMGEEEEEEELQMKR